MMMIFHAFLICTAICIQNFVCAEETTEKPKENVTTVASVAADDDSGDSGGDDDGVRGLNGGLGWIGDGISNVVESIVPTSEGIADVFEGRTMCRKRKKHHKHNKFLMPMLLGFLLIKSILLPVALKALAVLSGKAVVLSLMSLILAAIVGLRRIAQAPPPTGFSYDGYSKYRRKDQLLDDRNNPEDDDPYGYYRERSRRK